MLKNCVLRSASNTPAISPSESVGVAGRPTRMAASGGLTPYTPTTGWPFKSVSDADRSATAAPDNDVTCSSDDLARPSSVAGNANVAGLAGGLLAAVVCLVGALACSW